MENTTGERFIYTWTKSMHSSIAVSVDFELMLTKYMRIFILPNNVFSGAQFF